MKNKFYNIFIDILKELEYPIEKVIIQVPKNPNHGDFSTNYPLINASEINRKPMEIAEDIVNKIKKQNSSLIDKIEFINPGFINVKINKSILSNELYNIIKMNDNFGKNNKNKSKRALVEFVSANPTGPLTIGHGRNAILGDVVSNILAWNGYNVEREYYFNNAGRQMRKLGESVYARYMEILNIKINLPEGGYEGLYIKDIAQEIFNKYNEKLRGDKNNSIFKETAEAYVFQDIKNTLNKIGLKFDSFFNENTLYDNNEIELTIKKLKSIDLVYKKDGALWFKASNLGRESDKVIIKSTGEPTYRLPDIAYHRDKYERGFDLMVDIFGADHMDAYPDVLSAIDAMGYSQEKVKVLIHQFVTVMKNNKPIKMSTRKANFISLEKLIDEVGSDVTRFFFIMRSMNTHLNFDIDIAKEQSDANPVFYIQYAYARCCNIIEKFEGKIKDIDESVLIELSQESESQLIGKLIEFPEIISKCSLTLEPQNISNYLSELSASFHSYYAKTRVIDSSNKNISEARIYLINAIRIVIKNGLTILGISTPNKM